MFYGESNRRITEVLQACRGATEPKAKLQPKLRFQSSGHLVQRADSLEKTLVLGKTEGRRRGRQRMRWWVASQTRWAWVWASSGSWWQTGKLGVLQSMGSQRVRRDWATELSWVTCGGKKFLFNSCFFFLVWEVQNIPFWPRVSFAPYSLTVFCLLTLIICNMKFLCQMHSMR